MRITILTNEYPPHIYGGAGVHVEYLTRELAALEGSRHQVDVRCFGDQHSSQDNLTATGTPPAPELPAAADRRHRKVLDPLFRNLLQAGSLERTDLVHAHTWYAHFAGCLARHLHKAPLVLSTHSLEPHRPWKAEQLGTGHDFTVWLERTSYTTADGIIAVSRAMKRDVCDLYGVDPHKVRVIHNGIDTSEYAPRQDPEVPAKYGLNPARPYVLFVGRITRQKGLTHLLRALKHLRQETQILICASSPDTEDIARETDRLMAEARALRGLNLVWVKEMVPRADLAHLYSQARVFVCPSVYEPFGIINLEAMACGTPVVASRVGGIVEAVADGRTGLLVDLEPAPGDSEPRDPEGFSLRLARGVNTLLDDRELCRRMGREARQWTVDHFGWEVIASRTLDFYKELVAEHARHRGQTAP